MKMAILATALAGALALAGIAGAPVTGAAVESAQFTGTVSEIVDPAAETGIPRRWMRQVGNPAPAGYNHGYQWGTPSITSPAGATMITFDGTLDVVDAVAGDFGLIGMSDTATLAAGVRDLNEGVYIYASMSGADTLVLGLSDGRADGGEYVQTFHTIDLTGTDRVFDVTFTIDGDADPAGCAKGVTAGADVATAEGCLTLVVDDLGVLTDSFGTITNAANDDELRDGGTAGWDGLASATQATGFDYDFTVFPADGNEPSTKDDCKKGGWEAYGFTNQGECVSSVAAPR